MVLKLYNNITSGYNCQLSLFTPLHSIVLLLYSVLYIFYIT